MVGMIIFLILINQVFLERVYLSHQLGVVKKAYSSIDDASTDGSFSTDEYDIEDNFTPKGKNSYTLIRKKHNQNIIKEKSIFYRVKK